MKTKSLVRAGIVFVALLSLGWIGLWFLGRPGLKTEITNPVTNDKSSNPGKDIFYNFGGATPQETIKLLVQALEKNDLKLAAKYFIPEIRESESQDLEKLYDSQLLADLIKTLKNIGDGRAQGLGHWRYEVNDETGQPAAQIDLVKNKNGLWKISSL